MTREHKEYLKRNPVELVNIRVINQHCGRFPTVEAAVKAVEERGERVVEVRGNQVCFDPGSVVL